MTTGGVSIQPVSAPIVVGATDDELGPLLAAATSLAAGCRHRRTQPLGDDRHLVELDLAGETDVGGGERTVAGPGQTFAGVGGDAVFRHGGDAGQRFAGAGADAGRVSAGAGDGVSASGVIRALRAQGFAAVAGPPRPGFEVVWARRNAPCWYRPGACVCFPWSPFLRSDAETVIEIDPGSGFGSGQHPTTILVLRWLAEANLSEARVLDVGCGTGVLGIAAALAGAGAVVGVDVADAAVASTVANSIRNGVADRLHVVDADLAALSDPFDVVVANIHAPVLIELAPQLRRLVRAGGSLVLSGLSPAQPSTVTAALRPLRIVWKSELDEWVAVGLSK